MNPIIYYLFFYKILTVHLSAILMIIIADILLIKKLKLNAVYSYVLFLFSLGLHEAIFNPVWILYFEAFSSIYYGLYYLKLYNYFILTAVGLLCFKLNLKSKSAIVFFAYFVIWILSGFITSGSLPNGTGNVNATGNYWEFGYNILYSIMLYYSVQKRK